MEPKPTPTTTTSTPTTKPPPPASINQPPPPAPTPRRRGPGSATTKRKSNASGGSASKRVRKHSFIPPHLQNHNGPVTRARQSPNKLSSAGASASASASPSSSYASSGAGVLVQQQGNESVLPLHSSSTVGHEIGTTTQDAVSVKEEEARVEFEPVIDAEFEAIRSRHPNAHVVPTPAAWFSWTKTHPIEERALPSFFNGKSEKRTSETYMEIRNLIMRKFHSNPKTHIVLKDLSELSVGELDARQEVMEFLEHWGLINFHPFPVNDCNTANTDGYTKRATLIEKLYQFETVQQRPRVGPKVNLSIQAMLPRLLPESTVLDEVRQEGPAVEYHCNSCSADCSRKRYHCQKQADFDLCSECYNSGKFDSGMSPTDFIVMEPAEVPGVSGGSWTDQETLLLLEALEIFGENNWNEIAEHVATKSKAQCILHFIQMPIEDTFFEDKVDFDASLEGNTNPGSANDDTSVLRDSYEKIEIKAVTDNDSSPLKESHGITENKSSLSNDSSTANKSSELTESKSATIEERPSSPKMDLSKRTDGGDENVAPGVAATNAINVLKEAFQVVGFLLEPGDSLSFADVGNPVMALAAYLAGLVEPDIAFASARGSLKAASDDSPGIQLAARHCFLLHDPPEDMKEPPISESADVEMLEAEAPKDDEAEKAENHQAENQKYCEGDQTVLVGNNQHNGRSSEKITNTPKETLPSISSLDEGKANICAAKESLDVREKDDPVSAVKEVSGPALPGMCKSGTINGPVEPALLSEAMPSSEKDAVPLGEISNCPEVPKDADVVCNSVSSEDRDLQATVTPCSAVETGTFPDESLPEVLDIKSEHTYNLSETKDDQNVDKVKHTALTAQTRDDLVVDRIQRAALTALSSAAVKAKLLADQEEDQIRKLATFLIDKQLHKLETKLALFSELESTTMKVREVVDKSRQRLQYERNQIIAARISALTTSTRVVPPSVPTNRAAMSYANSVPKMTPSKNPQKPPV